MNAEQAKLLAQRRCIECARKLKPTDQGALCSDCYFGIICDPRLADPAPPAPSWRTVASEPR